MKKICIDIPQTKREAIDLIVKSAVNSDDIDQWLVNSQKPRSLKKLVMFHDLARENGLSLPGLKQSDFEDIAAQVEQQVAELIIGFEE